MKVASGVLGIIAGLLGFAASIFTLFLGGLGRVFESESASTVVGLGWGGLLFSLIVIVLGSMAFRGGVKVAYALLICSIIGAILGGMLVAICMILAFIGGFIGVLANKENHKEDEITSHLSERSLIDQSAKNINQKQMSKKVGGIVLISVVFLIAFLIFRYSSDISKVSTKEQVEILETLAKTKPEENLTPYGELGEIFTFNSDSTDIQRANALKDIKGKVIVWTLPVYEVSQGKDANNFNIQTSELGLEIFGESARWVGTLINLTSESDDEIKYISGLKTGNEITIKGVLTGDSTLRSLKISPAILWSAEKEKEHFPERVIDDTQATNETSAQVEFMDEDDELDSKNTQGFDFESDNEEIISENRDETKIVQVDGPSFDCGKSLSAIESIICNDKILSKLDRNLADAYAFDLYISDKEIARASQLSWIKRRNECKSRECIEQVYIERHKELAPWDYEQHE